MRDYAKGRIRHEKRFLHLEYPGFSYMVGCPDGNGPQTVECIEKVLRYVADVAYRDGQRAATKAAAMAARDALKEFHPETQAMVARAILSLSRKRERKAK